jgi:putrescine transport system permease protein
VIFSFNANRLVTVWSGFSLQSYTNLWNDPQLLPAAWLSLQIAAVAASIALVLGTLCAVALVRFRRFRGKTVLQATVSAPLVMPDVITGLALLLLFVAMQSLIGWPSGRGILTIIIAHATFCTAYVTVVVQSRLVDMDHSIEEAAMDLGATPVRVFFDITLPVIAPALVSGWLLAFTLSLDDLVIASFVSGPGSSTLPMIIFSKVRLGVSPEVNALATIIIGVVALAVVIATLIGFRSSGRERRA